MTEKKKTSRRVRPKQKVELEENISFASHLPYESTILPESEPRRPIVKISLKEEKAHYLGHRERLRERFMNSNSTIVDYELLELILFRSIIRADVKPLAKRLIGYFGSMFDVFGAEYKELLAIPGCGPNTAIDIKIIHQLLKRLTLAPLSKKQSIFPLWEALLNHCRLKLSSEKREHFYILFLDKKNALLSEELQQIGTIDHTPVYPREVLRRILDLGATSIVLVHNHPSGDPEPSSSDIEITLRLQAAVEPLGIAVQDHLIIGRNSYCSLKQSGFL